MNKVAAVAWELARWTSEDLIERDAIPIRELRAELRGHGLNLTWDPGVRPGRHPKQPGFNLYTKGGQAVAFGTLPDCCRAALIHTGIVKKEET